MYLHWVPLGEGREGVYLHWVPLVRGGRVCTFIGCPWVRGGRVCTCCIPTDEFTTHTLLWSFCTGVKAVIMVCM